MSDVIVSQVTSKAASVTSSAPGTQLVGRNTGAGRNVLIANAGSATIYIGPLGVTTASGIPLGAGEKISFECGAAIYAITAGDAVNVRVMEVYPS